jgi:flagellar hook-length control protein FliK
MKDVGFNPIVKSFPSNQRVDAKQVRASDAQGKKTGTFTQILEKNVLKEDNRGNRPSVSSNSSVDDESTEIQSKEYKSLEGNEKTYPESMGDTKGHKLKKPGRSSENLEGMVEFLSTWQQPLFTDVTATLPECLAPAPMSEEKGFDFNSNPGRIFEKEIELIPRGSNSVSLTGSPTFFPETFMPTFNSGFAENPFMEAAPIAPVPQRELSKPVNFLEPQAQVSPEVMSQMQSLMQPAGSLSTLPTQQLRSVSDFNPRTELLQPTETLDVDYFVPLNQIVANPLQKMVNPLQNFMMPIHAVQKDPENFLSGGWSVQPAAPLQVNASQQGVLELPLYEELEVTSLVFSEEPRVQTFGNTAQTFGNTVQTVDNTVQTVDNTVQNANNAVQLATPPDFQQGQGLLQGALGKKIETVNKESLTSLQSSQSSIQALDAHFLQSLQIPVEGMREEIFTEEKLVMPNSDNLSAPQSPVVRDDILIANNFGKQNEGLHDKEGASEFLNEKDQKKVEKQDEKISSVSAQPLLVKSEEISPRIEEKVRTITQSVVDRAQNLSDQLQARGGGTAKLQLTDKSFGTVNLEIRLATDNRIFIEISSSNEHLRKELESKVDDLKKALEGQKLNLAEFKISQETTVTNSNTQNSFDSQNQSGQQNAQQQSSNSPFSSSGHGGGRHQSQGFSGNDSGSQQGIGSGFARKSFAHHDAMNASTRQKSVQRGANGSLKVTA